ncbi:MAG: hypothetical protein ACUZ8A_06670 [Candidatus Bathyanammoxibius sp.]
MRRTLVIDTKTELYTEECYKCGVLFAMPTDLCRHLQDNGGTFYCPNGHGQVYRNSTMQILRQDLEKARRDALSYMSQRDGALDSLDTANKEARRLKRRAHAGVCPNCRRHFVNVERHMKSKHGDAS